MTGPMLRMDIRGRGGVALKDAWEAGPRTYLGLQIAGFPNLFTITGPGSPSVLCNMPVAIEQHADWITDCIEHMREKGVERIEAQAEAVDKWVAEVNEVADKTVLPLAKHSWSQSFDALVIGAGFSGLYQLLCLRDRLGCR